MIDEVPVIGSRSGFGAAVLWGFEQAIARGARSITCVDRDFADWPLDDPGLQQRLTAWLRLPQRKLVLLASGYDDMLRMHPRFVAWRAPWSHAVQGWTPPPDSVAELPTLLVDDGAISIQLIDPVHWHGRADIDAGRAQLWRQRIDAVLQRSEPGFAVSCCGL